MKRSSVDGIEMAEGARMQRMPFLSTGKSLGTRFYNYGRHFRNIAFFIILGTVIIWVVDTWGDAWLNWSHEDNDDALTPMADMGQALHVLIPATHPGVNLCRVTTGLNLLGYPNPVLLAWKGESEDSKENQIPAKITQALKYVRTLENEQDLVVMTDAYDTWFQLPPQTLRARYFKLMEKSNYRMRRRLGRRAVRREEMKQTVVFGARKDCVPNQLSEIACYPVPESPLPRDMYGNNTDTIMGRSKHTSFRPRYLDAGFMMGPAGDVRRLLERAQELVETLPGAGILDNGDRSRSAATLYEGDAQGVFARIFGEQAFQREAIRQRYRSWFKKWSLPHTPGSVEGHAYPDLMRPDFTHERAAPLPGHPREYGINLDFSASLVTNMAHSLADLRNLLFDGREGFADGIGGRNRFDCQVRLQADLPEDIGGAPWPKALSVGDQASWQINKYFANICLGNIPVVVHHNNKDDKSGRDRWWNEVWYEPYARASLAKMAALPEDAVDYAKGAFTDKGKWITWSELCPAEFEKDIFRDQREK